MGLLRGMTLSAKINGAFALICALVVVLGVSALYQTRTLGAANDEVTDKWMVRSRLIGDLRFLTGAQRSTMLQALVSSPTDAEAMRTSYETYHKQFVEGLTKYERLIDDQEERASFNEAREADRDGTAKNAAAFEATIKGDAKTAIALATGETRTLALKINTAMQKLNEFVSKGADAAGNAASAAEATARIQTLVLIVVALLVSAIAIVTIRNGVSRPLTGMAGAMRRLADGDKAIEIAGGDRGDEIGEMAKAVLVFKEGLIEADRLAEANRAEEEAKRARAEAVDRLIRAFDETASDALRAVAAAATELDGTARGMEGMARETSLQAGNVAAAAEQTSANVQTVATAAEEMTSSIQEIGTQVARSTDIAGRAVEEASRTNETVKGLAEAAQRIGDVVALITNIASQTNLLALNATIEAARAGEAGKGFAVVASEVKNLAGQTGKATEEIAAQVAAIQNETNRAVAAIGGIAGTIGNMNEISTTIAAAIEEQSAAIGEIARNVQQAAQGTQQVSGNIAHVTRTANDTGAAATEVLSAAGELSRHSEGLSRDVEQFLAGIRAA